MLKENPFHIRYKEKTDGKSVREWKLEAERMAERDKSREEADERTAERMMPEGTAEKKKGLRRRWSGKRKLIAAAAVLAGILALAKGFGGGGEAPVAVRTELLSRGDVAEKLSLTGPVSGTDSVEVFSNLHSQVTALYVKVGDRVEKGQLLAELDTGDAGRDLDMARNTYKMAVAEYKEQEAAAVNGYEKAVQDYNTAKKNYDRSAALAQAGVLSPAELEEAGNELEDAARQAASYRMVDGRPMPPESYELRIKDAEYGVQMKEEALEDTKISSPITGTVVRVNTKVGRFADETGEGTAPLFVIENLDTLEMEIDVSEYSIGKVALGQQAVISADILNGKTARGEVTAISPTGEEKGGGSAERVIPATIRILDRNTRLMAGITAKAELILNEAENVWTVSASAVADREDGPCIAVVRDGVLCWIPVERGVESDIRTEIRARGEAVLEEGMAVVSNPDPSLADGTAVSLIPAV